MTRIIPYGRQTIEDDDVEAVVAALKDDYLTTGPRVEAFEAALAAATGASHAVVCNSGTAALHLAAMALDLEPIDQVVVPSLTFVATANAPGFTGAEIIFADVAPDTGLMTPETLAQALKRAPRARVCFPVHLNGAVCDLEGLRAIAAPHGVTLIEDACHALGATDAAGDPAGACRTSVMAAFSFHPVKAIAMGEGGAVTTNDAALAERCRLFRNHGLTRDPAAFSRDMRRYALADDGSYLPWYYELKRPAPNYRAPDVLCALGLSQLKKLDRFLARRRAIADAYDEAFAPLAPLARPVPRPPKGGSAWHLYVLLIDFPALGRPREEVMAALRARGVGSQVHYIPVHLQSYYREQAPHLQLPGALSYYRRALSLPIYPSMTDDDVATVIDAVRAVLGAPLH